MLRDGAVYDIKDLYEAKAKANRWLYSKRTISGNAKS